MRTSVHAKRKMLVYLILFLALCIFSLIADSLAPHDAELVNLLEAKKAPGGEYLMGTDWLGRCIWSRILSGASSSIFASLMIVALSMLVGCTIGLISGYMGGIADEIMMRIVDVFLAFPGIVLSIAVAGMLGPGIRNGVLALAATGWTQYARLIRSYVLSLREENYVKAERSERVVNSAASYISECHPSGRRDRDSALKRSDAQHFRPELSRARLFLGGMGKHAFRRTQSDAAVPVGGAVSGISDLYGHYII